MASSMADRQAQLDALLARHRDSTGWAALARAVSLVENSEPWELRVPGPTHPAHLIGITGPPGAGKSTLTGQLIAGYADRGKRVGVLAVDPSSPVTGGAVLGDRVRMEDGLSGRDDVYVRSIASRGATGALAASAHKIVRLYQASGSFDVIVIETVGAGQTEVAIAGLGDTVVLVTVPGLGDAVQAIKAGLLEVADTVVVNMADRPGARETIRHFRLALGQGIPVLATTATDGTGVEELIGALDERWTGLELEGGAEARSRRLRRETVVMAQEWIRACASERTNGIEASASELETEIAGLLKEASEAWSQRVDR